MKHIFTISLCFLALSLSAQETITYPYNPDGDADGLVAVPDIQDLLAVYGSPFSPAEIMVGDTALSEWIQILYQALEDQQAVINAMQGAGGCNFNYPHGLDGTPYSHSFSSQGDLMIPEGKVFYMNYESGYEGRVTINGGVYNPNIDSAPSIQQGDRGNPIIYPSGLILSDLDGSNINGLMIDENTNIDVVFHSFANGDLVVPEGKFLYVTRTTTNIVSNLNDVTYSFEILSSSQPIVLPSEATISPSSTYSSSNKFLFGYLVDEDYFADCGGGGSSEGGLGLAFGKRVNLEESEDGGPIPWNSDKNYGVYDFESDGLVFFSNPGETNLLILNDSIEMLELMTPEVFYEYSVGELDPGSTITIPVRKDEKLVIEGYPFMFNLQGHLFQWIPLESEPVGSSGESELDVFYATDFEVDEWNNFLPLQVIGSPDIVVYNHPLIGSGTLPIIAPNPNNYDQFDQVKFMLGGLVPDNPPLPNILAQVYFTRCDGEEEEFGIQADRTRSLTLGPDGFWRYSD